MRITCEACWPLQAAPARPRFPRLRGLWLLAGGLIVLGLILRAQFLPCIAKGESMLPALHSGALLLVDKRAYKTKLPARGDIVVARTGHDLIVKRVVGLPGEEIEVRRGILYINQRPFAEPYPVEPGSLSLRRGRLLEDKYALLGDNRSVSSSLAVHAVVSKDLIVGKVIRSLCLRPS